MVNLKKLKIYVFLFTDSWELHVDVYKHFWHCSICQLLSMCLLPGWCESKLPSAKWTTPLSKFFATGTNLLDDKFFGQGTLVLSNRESLFILCFSACNSAATFILVLVSRRCHRMVGYIVLCHLEPHFSLCPWPTTSSLLWPYDLSLALPS